MWRRGARGIKGGEEREDQEGRRGQRYTQDTDAGRGGGGTQSRAQQARNKKGNGDNEGRVSADGAASERLLHTILDLGGSSLQSLSLRTLPGIPSSVVCRRLASSRFRERTRCSCSIFAFWSTGSHASSDGARGCVAPRTLSTLRAPSSSNNGFCGLLVPVRTEEVRGRRTGNGSLGKEGGRGDHTEHKWREEGK